MMITTTIIIIINNFRYQKYYQNLIFAPLAKGGIFVLFDTY